MLGFSANNISFNLPNLQMFFTVLIRKMSLNPSDRKFSIPKLLVKDNFSPTVVDLNLAKYLCLWKPFIHTPHQFSCKFLPITRRHDWHLITNVTQMSIILLYQTWWYYVKVNYAEYCVLPTRISHFSLNHPCIRIFELYVVFISYNIWYRTLFENLDETIAVPLLVLCQCTIMYFFVICFLFILSVASTSNNSYKFITNFIYFFVAGWMIRNIRSYAVFIS